MQLKINVIGITTLSQMEDILASTVVVKSHKSNSLINRKMIFRILGVLLHVEGLMFAVCMLVALAYGEHDVIHFLISAAITEAAAFLLQYLGKGAPNNISRRDGYCIVAFTWLLFTVFGMIPAISSGEISSITNAFFETMSGFTTTGATVLSSIDELSHAMLFWRSLTQWIGGLGIIFFTVAFLPIFGLGNQVLFSAEATGVNHDKIHPKISVMGKWIWTIYICITAVCFCLLLAGGMGFFDAVCHSFSTAATGGFSTKGASVAYFDSPFIEYVISIFMIIAGINFSLYFLCLKGQFKHLLKDEEVRLYLTTIFVLTIVIAISLYAYNGYDVEKAFRKSLFQVASILTSCGFATDDYNQWMPFTWLLLVYAMITGGCTGSTCAGIKCMRILIIFKNIRNEFNRRIHPRAVLPVKINTQTVSPRVISTVSTFALFYLCILFVGWVLIMAMGVDFMDAFGVAVSSLCNIGPALGHFGPEYSWDALPDMGKWLTSFYMLIGRLELFAVLLMFAPGFWRKS